MKNNIHLSRALFVIALLVGIIATSGTSVNAQRVRLRSRINPPCSTGSNNPSWKFSDIYADGNIAVQGGYYCKGAFIYDISNPDAPVLASWYNPGNNQQFLEAIVVGNRGYFGSGGGGGGVHIVDLSDPYHPVLLGVVDSAHGGGHNLIHEMMVWGNFLIENYNGTGTLPVRVINISDPANPVFKWQFTSGDGGWIHAMHIRGNRMFTSEYTGSRVEIYDISNLDAQPPALLGFVQSNSTNHSSWTSEDGNYLYSCRETFDGDLRVYDIHNPAQPLLVKTVKAGDLGLNAVTPHNPVVMGNRLYISWYQAGLQVFDISNPANPVRIGQYDTFQPAFALEAKPQSLVDEPWDMICGGSNLQNNLPNNYDGNWAVFPFLGEDKVLAGDLATGLYILDVTGITAPVKNPVADFDGDGKTDLSTYSPSTGNWQIETSSNSASSSISWGNSTDVMVPGDYDGDGKSDIAVWRPSNGTWYIYGSTAGVQIAQFGVSGDVPVAADYDADGKTDIAVWRPATGDWYIYRSSLGVMIVHWGLPGDKVFTGDYEGDGKPDLVAWRPSTGAWYILRSSSTLPIIAGWGIAGDKPMFADFDGDGRSDIAAYRPSNGTWYIVNSSNGSVSLYTFGLAEDKPIPSDFDGDGKADIAVYRPSQNIWYRLNSSNGGFIQRGFGQPGDMPVPSSVQPQ